MARMKRIGNILRGVGVNADRDPIKGDAKNSIGNMGEDGSDYPGQAKTGYSGPMNKFGRNSGPNHPGDSYIRAANNKADGAPDRIGGLAGRGKPDGTGWPKSLKFQNASGGSDYPNRPAAKDPGPTKVGTPPAKDLPIALNRGGNVPGHGPKFGGPGKDTGLKGVDVSLAGKGWPKSLRKDIAGHGTLAG